MPARKRKKKPTVDIPLFEEEAATCSAKGCGLPIVDEKNQLCVLHAMAHYGRTRLQKASRRGDAPGLLYGALVSVLDATTPYLVQQGTRILENPGEIASRFARRSPPETKEEDPFEILGLERTSSADEIRATQRKLAAIYHSDIAGNVAAEAKIRKINSAAARCLETISK